MLYEEDHFHPSNKNDVEQQANKLLDNINSSSSSNYVSYYVEIPKEERQRDHTGRIKKVRKVELYGSGDMGTRIRNAVTGQMTEHIVGTEDEYNYWSVCDCRGVNGKQTSLMLFYDSPEQYERHMRLQLPQNVKEEWLNRVLEKRTSNGISNTKKMLGSSLKRTFYKPISDNNMTLPWENGWSQ